MTWWHHDDVKTQQGNRRISSIDLTQSNCQIVQQTNPDVELWRLEKLADIGARLLIVLSVNMYMYMYNRLTHATYQTCIHLHRNQTPPSKPRACNANLPNAWHVQQNKCWLTSASRWPEVWSCNWSSVCRYVKFNDTTHIQHKYGNTRLPGPLGWLSGLSTYSLNQCWYHHHHQSQTVYQISNIKNI